AVESQKPYLSSLLHETGVILFRGSPLSLAHEFNQLVEAFGFPEYHYVGGSASRTRVVGRVFTANESPPDQQIPFHHEMAHVPESPKKLMFFCEEEPGSGGETPVVLSHIVYERMRVEFPEFVGKLEEEGLLSTRVLAEEDNPSFAIGRGWKSTFSTTDKHVSQQRSISNRAESLRMKLEWISDGESESLVRIIVGPIPAIKLDESRNRKVWFNGMVASYTAFGDKCTFDGGDPLASDAVYRLPEDNGRGECGYSLGEGRCTVTASILIIINKQENFFLPTLVAMGLGRR
ncbi:Clavaminate synthase-like protein At3g21360, partial [Linum perenne]